MNSARVQYNVREIIANYGTEFKTTGGGFKQKGGDSIDTKVEQFIRKAVDNRVLDVYLKYLGITLLTPATLVPLALIMGKNTFQKVVKDIKKNDDEIQKGGKGFLDIEVPILDDQIVGNGLKLAGITALTVSPYTLIPLGLAMYIYELHSSIRQKSQKGGKEGCALNANLSDGPAKTEFHNVAAVKAGNNFATAYQQGGSDPISFGNQWDKGHCRNPNLDWTSRGPDFAYKGGQIKQKTRRSKQSNNIKKGGTGLILGASVPYNVQQAADDFLNGVDLSPNRYNDYINNNMQLHYEGCSIPSQTTIRLPYMVDTVNYRAPPSTNVCAMTQSCGIPSSMAGGSNKKRGGASSD
jgi:hypothetical protein